MKVSIRTPIAIVKPISVRLTSGRTASAEKVPGEDDAGRGDHGSGHGQAAEHALSGAVLEGLLAHAGHQEDVVVDPQRDEEDEREQRQGRIDAREVEDVLEEEGRDPEGGPEGEDHRRDQDQRRDHGAQQGHQDQEDDDERDRDDHLVVARRRLAQVELLGRRPADERVVAAGAVRRLADPRHEVEAGGAERVLVEGRLELRPGRALLLLGVDLGDPGRLGDRVADRVELGLVGDDDVGRRVRAGREALLDQLLALDRVDVVAEAVAARSGRC